MILRTLGRSSDSHIPNSRIAWKLTSKTLLNIRTHTILAPKAVQHYETLIMAFDSFTAPERIKNFYTHSPRYKTIHAVPLTVDLIIPKAFISGKHPVIVRFHGGFLLRSSSLCITAPQHTGGNTAYLRLKPLSRGFRSLGARLRRANRKPLLSVLITHNCWKHTGRICQMPWMICGSGQSGIQREGLEQRQEGSWRLIPRGHSLLD